MSKRKSAADKARAAVLVAADELSNAEIAAEIGISERALNDWKANPEFAEQVAIIVEETRAVIRKRGIAIVENRVAALDDRWKRMKRVIAERAADESTNHVPGGVTGLLVRQTKFVKVYEAVPREEPPRRPSAEWTDDDPDAMEGEPEFDIFPTKRVVQIEEFAVDTGLLSELRAHELQAAKELGQLTEKRDITSGGKSFSDLFGGLSDADLDERLARAEGRKAAPPVPQ